MNLGLYTSVEVFGDKILYRGRKEDGEEIRLKIPYAPTLFTNSPTPTKYKSIFGVDLGPIKFEGIKAARDFVNQYKDVESFPLYGMTNYAFAFISDNFRDTIKWSINQLFIASIDIETRYDQGFPDPALANQEILAITHRMKDKIVAFGMKDYTPKNPKTIYVKCANEYDMLHKYVEFWQSNTPDIVTGWNIRLFDIPYLINRIVVILGEQFAKLLSPWKMVDAREVTLMGKERRVYEIRGIAVLDYMELFRKFDVKGQSQESYKLDAIARYVLKRGKVQFKGSLQNLYDTDFQTFMEYNEEDVNLVHDMNKKGQLIELALTLAYNAKVNISDVFFQTRMWDSLIFNHLRDKDIVIPFRNITDSDSFDGAYVKDTLVGMFKWVASFDLTSLYPHLIMMYNISPETLVPPEQLTDELRELASKASVDAILNKTIDLSILKKYNYTMTPNGAFFRRDIQGFLPELMEKMFGQRKAANDLRKQYEKEKEQEIDHSKKEELEALISAYNNKQMALKISLNSAYGALGNPGFRYYLVALALGVTSSGQLSIRWVGEDLNEMLQKATGKPDKDFIIASDTDSVYLDLGELVAKAYEGPKDATSVINWLDKACKKRFTPFIDGSFNELADFVNAYAQKMEMKREALATKGVWTGKKHYILDVYDSEGVRYKKPKLKITGMEAVRSSVPKTCRNALKGLYYVILRKDEEFAQSYIENYRKRFEDMQIGEVAFPRGVTNLDKFSQMEKSIPIHVKGSLTYNAEIKKRGLTRELEQIKEGSKIRYVYLKTPNPFHSHVMAFPDQPPEQFDLGRWVDYDLQFDKAFLAPARKLMTCIDWHTEHVNTLEDFFE